MRNYFLPAICFFLISLNVFAQGGLGTAKAEFNNGSIGNAKVAIDKAIEHPKAKEVSETWLYMGKIYMAIASDQTGLFSKLDNQAAIKAYNALLKARDIESRSLEERKAEAEQNGKRWKEEKEEALMTEIKSELENMYAPLINAGIDLYKEEKYQEAMPLIMKANNLMPQDTLSTMLMVDITHKTEQKKEYEKYLNQLLNLDFQEKQAWYINLIILYKNELQDHKKALEVVDRALQDYPNEIILIQYKGNIYEALNQYDKALQTYLEGLKHHPNEYAFNLSVGAMYYNQAVELSSSDKDLSQEEIIKINQKVKEVLSKALPYLEKANEQKPDNPDVLDLLSIVYSRLDMDEKAEEIDRKIEELKE